MNKIYELKAQQAEVRDRLYGIGRFFEISKSGYIRLSIFDDPNWVALVSNYNRLTAKIEIAKNVLDEVNARLHGAWILRSLDLPVDSSFNLIRDFETSEVDFSNPYVVKAMLENITWLVFDDIWPGNELKKVVVHRHGNHVRFYIATAPNERSRAT